MYICVACNCVNIKQFMLSVINNKSFRQVELWAQVENKICILGDTEVTVSFIGMKTIFHSRYPENFSTILLVQSQLEAVFYKIRLQLHLFPDQILEKNQLLS